MTKILTSLIVVASCLTVQGQIEKIDTDRPDQTESASTVPKDYFQAEIGFNKENSSSNNYSLIHPTVLLKYGLRRLELRLEAVCHSDHEQLVPQPKWTTGFDPVEIGFKALLIDEKKILPKTSVIVHIGIPVFSSKAFRSDHVAPSFRLVTQKRFTDHFGIGSNLGMAWDGYNSKPAWLYTFSPGFSLGQKWYTYIEAFGFIQEYELPQHNIDGGIACYISQDLKIDFSGGFGISTAAPRSYIALGLSFRFNAAHK